MARTFGQVIDRLKGIEDSVNTSTFGRVFRLDGSGHVGYRSPPHSNGKRKNLVDDALLPHTARADTGRQLLYRDPRRADNFRNYGVHHRRQRSWTSNRPCSFGLLTMSSRPTSSPRLAEHVCVKSPSWAGIVLMKLSGNPVQMVSYCSPVCRLQTKTANKSMQSSSKTWSRRQQHYQDWLAFSSDSLPISPSH